MGLNLGVGSPSDSRRVSTPGHPALVGKKYYNSDGTPFWTCKVYNGTGSALTANRPYLLTFSGASTTAQNPRVTALAAQAGVSNHIVIAHEAIADATWGEVCFQGYHSCGVDGTTDVAAGDFLLVSAGVSTTGLVKDGTTRTQQSCAIACEAQATNSTVDIRVFLFGGPALTSLTQSFAGASFSGQVLAADGTGGAPAYSFTNEPDCGLYVAGTNTIGFSAAGSGRLTLSNTTFTIVDGINVTLGTTNGNKIGTATTQKIGFFNATPIVQPSAYTQTFATADKTHAARTATAVTNAFGTANGTFEDTSGTSAAIANNFAECSTSINALIADLADTAQLVNSLVDDLQALGLVG